MQNRMFRSVLAGASWRTWRGAAWACRGRLAGAASISPADLWGRWPRNTAWGMSSGSARDTNQCRVSPSAMGRWSPGSRGRRRDSVVVALAGQSPIGGAGRGGPVQQESTATGVDAGGPEWTRADGGLHRDTRMDGLPLDGMQEVWGSNPHSSTGQMTKSKT